MGLLSALDLKPTRAMLARAGKAPVAKTPPAQAPEMKALIARFQTLMGRIKALEADQAPQAGALRAAAAAAGNLATSPKGIVQAGAALDRVEAQIEDAKLKLAEAQRGAKAADGAAADAAKLASELRARLKSLEQRGRKAIDADPRNGNAGWLGKVVGDFEGRIDEIKEADARRRADDMRKQLDWLEESVVEFEASAAGKPSPSAASVDGAKLAAEARRRLESLEQRGRKAIAADPGNSNDGWLTEVVGNTEGRIADLEERNTKREADGVRKQLDWIEESVVRFEADAKRVAAEAGGGPAPAAKPAEESPALQKVKAQFRHVMAEIRKLAEAQNPQAEALKQAAVAAGNLATSPKGIERARLALDQVTSDIAKAKAQAEQARADAAKAQADAAQAAAQTFDLVVGGRRLSGVHRAEALQALRLETGKLKGQLEGGWAFHVDQMKLPAELPFQAWLTSGVDAVKSFVTGRDAARIPDLNIWDAAREMMIEVSKAEKKGDVQAIAALLPKIETSITRARSKVGKYQDQMEGSAETGVDAGRFVEDTAVAAIGKLTEMDGGGTVGKIGMQAVARAGFEEVEQITEWVLGQRKSLDGDRIVGKAAEEAVGAIFKELVAGALKGPFKSAFGSYLGKGIDDATLKAMNLSRDAFMTAGQKYLAEFAAKQGAGLIKSAITKLVKGKLPSSPQALVDGIAAELTKGSAKQLIVDGIKLIAEAAVDAK